MFELHGIANTKILMLLAVMLKLDWNAKMFPASNQ